MADFQFVNKCIEKVLKAVNQASSPRKLNRGWYLEIILRIIKKQHEYIDKYETKGVKHGSKVGPQTFINEFIRPIAEKSNILKYRTLI
tara:strand:- start:478 stop:741 length:264 start_codon:yes stop_codon:yes gene_type:complete